MLEFSKQGYYRWKTSPVTERDWADAHLVNAALDIHADDPAFGYRFIADELPGKGILAGENRVQRLCRDHGIWSVFSKKRGLNRKPGPPVHNDLVERDFTATAPNELWLTDITEHPTAEGKLYLCAVKDVYSGRIVGYSMDPRMKSSLAVAALENAVRARRPAGTVVHSDSETVLTGIPGGSLTRTVMDATGCWCRVRPGVLDSHSDRQLLSFPGSVSPQGVPGEALRLAAGVT
ncbi:transposase InsO family protein [Arthrobacter oryzae]|nr:transposase InsO family protein [Arthrobacter oryzae]